MNNTQFYVFGKQRARSPTNKQTQIGKAILHQRNLLITSFLTRILFPEREEVRVVPIFNMKIPGLFLILDQTRSSRKVSEGT
jgi:hypothetical protein